MKKTALDGTISKTDLIAIDLADFEDRSAITAHIRALCGYLPAQDQSISDMRGQRAQALGRLAQIDPELYAKTRNHIGGKVTHLSAYIRHGLINLSDIRNKAMEMSKVRDAEKLVQQMAWRDYWQRLYKLRPDIIWQDAEDYKTGFTPDDYADELPEDIMTGQTGVAAIDAFIGELLSQGTLHNHARLYVAAYICHWRRIKWQAGATAIPHRIIYRGNGSLAHFRKSHIISISKMCRNSRPARLIRERPIMRFYAVAMKISMRAFSPILSRNKCLRISALKGYRFNYAAKIYMGA